MRSRWRQGAHKGQVIGTLYDYKDRFELAERALYVAEPRFMSVSGRFMHLWCVSCGKAALFGYVVARRRVVAIVVIGAIVVIVELVALAGLVVLSGGGAAGWVKG